jgi:transcriptional regulator with XRE-family HTH domain
MLDSSDTAIVMRWLSQALEDGVARGLTKSGLAAHCGVKPQAVSGWLRTGRIKKASLALASEYLGSAPSFTGRPAVLQAEEPVPAYSALTSQEIDLLIAFRALPKALQRARYDQLMADAEDSRKFSQSVLSREGVNGRVSDARAAQFLPPAPHIDAPETVPGALPAEPSRRR